MDVEPWNTLGTVLYRMERCINESLWALVFPQIRNIVRHIFEFATPAIDCESTSPNYPNNIGCQSPTTKIHSAEPECSGVNTTSEYSYSAVLQHLMLMKTCTDGPWYILN